MSIQLTGLSTMSDFVCPFHVYLFVRKYRNQKRLHTIFSGILPVINVLISNSAVVNLASHRSGVYKLSNGCYHISAENEKYQQCIHVTIVGTFSFTSCPNVGELTSEGKEEY